MQNTNYILHRDNIDYYEALARGGTSRVITGDHPVNRYNPGYRGKRLDFYSPRSGGPPGSGDETTDASMESEKSIEALVRVCHQHDTLVAGSAGRRISGIHPGGGSGPEGPCDGPTRSGSALPGTGPG